MSSKSIRFLEAAVEEAKAAYDWYASQNPAAAEAFIAEIDDAIEQIRAGYLVIHTDDRREEARRYGGGMHVLVEVESVNAEHARLKSLGVIVTELLDQPWGWRTFDFSDPDGYTWSYGQPLRGTAGADKRRVGFRP